MHQAAYLTIYLFLHFQMRLHCVKVRFFSQHNVTSILRIIELMYDDDEPAQKLRHL
jgi:hypothetical protein